MTSKFASAKSLLTATIASVVFISANANAALLDLPDVPLFIEGSVAPNVFFTLDDSGSMDHDIMTRLYWEYEAYDPDPRRDDSFLSNETGSQLTGKWRSTEFDGAEISELDYEFLLLHGDDVQVLTCDGSSGKQSAEACTGTRNPVDVDWRVRSADLNVIYYQPDTSVYEPWDGPCADDGTACADVLFSAAPSNPYDGEAGNSLIRNLGTHNGGFVYEVWIDDNGYSGNRPQRGTNFNNTGIPNGEVDLWDSHVRIQVGANTATATLVTYNPVSDENAPDKGLNETETLPATTLGAGPCYNVLGPKSLVAAEIADGTPFNGVDEPSCRTVVDAQQDIANWYSYSRRRAFVAKAAIAKVLSTAPGFRYGLTVLNRYDVNEPDGMFTEVPDASVSDFGQHNLDLLKDLYSFDWLENGTPLRDAMQRTGVYFAGPGSPVAGSPPHLGKTDPIIHECQQNFNLLFTDGFYNGEHTGFNDLDGDIIQPTLGDLAYRYYRNDLNQQLADEVITTDFDKEVYPDDTMHQHLKTFSVAFGVSGNLSDTDNPPDGWPNPNGVAGKRLNERGQEIDNGTYVDDTGTATGGWGDPTAGGSTDPVKIDDMWHAAYNSRGSFTAASTPAELTQKLLDSIGAIGVLTGTAAATAQSTATLNTTTRIFTAAFDSTNWTGTVSSLPISDGTGNSPSTCTTEQLGEICPAEWPTAGQEGDLGNPDNRQIITYNPDTPGGVRFLDVSELSGSQQTALNTNPVTSTPDGRGQDRLNYLRGKHDNEGAGPNDFRPRAQELGDVIDSDLVFAGPPAFFYSDDVEPAAPYSAFRSQYAERTPMLYVGANDGMLHGFNVEDGSEVFAYVPNAVFYKLNELTGQNYASQHKYFVNGDPTQGDAYFDAPGPGGAAWHTMLAGTLGLGGQGLFALNVTNPEDGAITDDPVLTEGNADKIVLWEFTDQDDADLGYTLGRANIVRMNNDRWAVVIGNGYNNTEVDSSFSNSGNAVLYILFIDGGTDGTWTIDNDYIKIDTTIGGANDPLGQGRNNGLAEVTAIDIDSDSTIDYIYGGDLFGNLWKFDVTSDNPNDWKNAAHFGVFFTALDPNNVEQPITVRPTVGRHPTDNTGVLVYFGTGKYLETGDKQTSVDGNGISTEQTQTLYAVYDRLIAGSDPDDTGENPPVHVDFDRNVDPEDLNLQQQQITFDDGANVLVSNDAVDWTQKNGWFMDLIPADDDGDAGTPPVGPFDNEGRRVAVKPLLRAGRVFFTVTIPASNPCDVGGETTLMALNSATGGTPTSIVFDINDDGDFDSDDLVSAQIVAGVRFAGIAQLPSFVNQTDTRVNTYTSVTSGGPMEGLISEAPGVLGRQSWRQMRPASSTE